MSPSSNRPIKPERKSTIEFETSYFTDNPPPKALKSHCTLVKAFISRHVEDGRRVILITSGGTTVPLENQTVRFIDNFSAGTRGATSAEYFLEEGYAVIFLHRNFSLLPYSRHFSHSTNCFLDFMHEGPDGSVIAKEEYEERMVSVLRKYNLAKKQNLLLLLPFTTVTDYLWELREIAVLMKPLGPNGLFYLAAAVSDFFVPQDRMSEHKIQSSAFKSSKGEIHVDKAQSQKLVIDLDPVPKFLKRLVDGWAPQSMIVSFKLETDPNILVSKAHSSLERYSHHLVIGNLLSTRKWEVVFVTRQHKDRWIRVPRHQRAKSMSGVETQVGLAAIKAGALADSIEEAEIDSGNTPILGQSQIEIESIIVPEVAKMHTDLIKLQTTYS
ncbi:MAG: hypothetical protein M1814_001557 [Vezdaea aestivalis]|nr:MAG: hypothetical protein M1814_001557 [Vezdaea aestivalis]